MYLCVKRFLNKPKVNILNNFCFNEISTGTKIVLSTFKPACVNNSIHEFLVKKRKCVLSKIPDFWYVHSPLNNNGNKAE